MKKKIVISLLFLLVASNSYAFLYKELDLKVTGSVSERYDDNLTYTKEDKKEDYITRLGLGLTAQYEGKRRSLDLSGRINHRFNAKYEDIKNNSEKTFSKNKLRIRKSSFSHVVFHSWNSCS